ncbi:MAG: GNAT family N-acetyltransferase [Muribaculaceae bacterium]|nr:GNAT family N-acetyltransferase [Muribaculaceae bacterium]
MLSSGRITLRALEPVDVDTLYRWENDTEIWGAGISLAPYSRKQLWDYIDSYEADIFKAKQLRFMIALRDGNETIGTIDLFDFDPANGRCGIGILISTPHRRAGYAREALGLAEEYCGKVIGMHQLYCTVGAANMPSRRLFESCGYRISGRLRSWLRTGRSYGDAFIFQKILS